MANEQTRRRFLHASAAGLAAVPLVLGPARSAASASRRAIGLPFPAGAKLPASPPRAPKKGSVGFAVVGLGYYGVAKVLPALAAADRCHVAAVVSGNPAKAAQVGAAYALPEDAIYSYDDFDRIANDDRIEAVYIVLPSGLHADWTEMSFAAGKHVLCEKPMALTAAECLRMIGASEAAGKHLMIAYRCHFEPFNLKAMRLMREGAVGAIKSIKAIQQYSMGPTSPAENWRVARALAGGGPLEDYGVYGLQSALYLSGEMPARVRASTLSPSNDPRFAEIFASVRTEFAFPSGARADLFTSYDTSPSRNHVSVDGAAGALVMEPATGYGGHTMTLMRPGSKKELRPGDPAVQFARTCDHLADIIRDGVENRTPASMGLRDVRLMEAIYASAAKGDWIDLDDDGSMSR